MKRLLLLIFFIFDCAIVTLAQISPKYFGPNALPVPDMIKCTTGKLQIEANVTGALGWLTSTPDKTVSTDLKIRIPLWTDRVNLCVWAQVMEWFWDNEQTREARMVEPGQVLSGKQHGDVYFSVDMLLLRETVKRPAITLRLACKTASGGNYALARYYDAPAYFCDLCVAKDFRISEEFSLSAALSAGFLCWQTLNGSQDDAMMYGAAFGFKTKPVNFAADFGGYFGWRDNGDKPMTLKLRADFIPYCFVSPFIAYQRGFIDWPFDQLKIGAAFSIDIFNREKKKVQ